MDRPDPEKELEEMVDAIPHPEAWGRESSRRQYRKWMKKLSAHFDPKQVQVMLCELYHAACQDITPTEATRRG